MTECLRRLRLNVLPERLAVCRLDPDADVPQWGARGPFVSVTRTPDELSIVCSQGDVPPSIQCERGWRCLKVPGPLEFSTVGIIASLSATLARAGISVFVISTYETDYLMVRSEDLDHAIGALLESGHDVVAGPTSGK